MNRFLLALVLLSAFVLLAACGGDDQATPTLAAPPNSTAVPESTPGSARATSTLAAQASGICAQGTVPEYIKAVVLAMDAREPDYTPVDITDEFEPTQLKFNAVVTLENPPKDLKLGAKWYLVQATGREPNIQLDENTLSIPNGESRNVAFSLSTPEYVWPAGTYCVEIYTDGNLAISKSFTVLENTTPSNATGSILRQVVVARDVDPGTFAPINPTSVFAASAPSIHVALDVVEAPPNTRFHARWYPPGQDPLDWERTMDGTRWMDLHILPNADGFPTGEYKVEIYINDQLADTRTFVVE